MAKVLKKKKSEKEEAKKQLASGKQEVATTVANPKGEEKRKKDISDKKKKKKKTDTEVREDKLQENNDKVSNAVGVAKPKPELRAKGIDTSKLPEHVTKRRIKLASTLTSDVIEVSLKDITGTSTTLYVNDIHDVLPVVMEQVYWVHTPGARWPLGRVSKEDYDFIHANAKGSIADDRHLFIVTDCAVNPTLSYSWKLAELKGKSFPMMDMILTQDKEFKNNPTFIHNRNPRFVVTDNEELDLEDDDDLFIMDDDEDEEPLNEEDEFEFSD